MNVKEAWIKAAVEHIIVEMVYYSSKTKKERTVREVEPDFVGYDRGHRSFGYWATFCHLRKEGPRCFTPQSILQLKSTRRRFHPTSKGRWKELVSEYTRLRLASKDF